MNGKCIFRGKKSFAPALFAAAILAAMALLFSCGGGSASSGDSYVSGDFGTGGNGTGGNGTGGGDNTGNEGNEGEGNGGENGNESGDGDEQSGNEQPTMKKDLEQLLKYYMTEAVYNNLSGKIEPANKINLSAQTIKDAGTIFPVLQDIVKEARTEEYFNSNKPSKITTTENDLNKALIALKEGYIDIQQSKLSILKKLNLEGTYNLSEIEIDNSSSLGDFSTATFTGSNITVDKINTARGTSLPKLSTITVKESLDETEDAKEVYNLYKAYSKNLNIVNLNGDFSAIAINGKEISGKSDYTLFESDTEAKDANNNSIISLSADAMVQMTEQLKIYQFDNMIVSGTLSKSSYDPVNWELVNIVFEGDMTKITHDASNHLYGIVYFKGKTYNTSNFQKLQGMLKLDNLDNTNFTISSSDGRFNVIDVRNVPDNKLTSPSYTGGISRDGDLNSVYFASSLKDNVDVYRKFKASNGSVFNRYFGEERQSGLDYNFSISSGYYPSSQTPRSLSDFEELGNSYIKNSLRMKFPTSARDSYTTDEFNALKNDIDKTKLEADKDLKELAKNDKRRFSFATKSFG